MAIVVVDGGARSILDGALAYSALYALHLFQNNHVPAVGDVLANYTECDFDGYAPQAPLVWAPASTVGGKAQALAPSTLWTKAAGATGNTVYGVFVTDSIGNLVCAERFAAPLPMTTPGEQVYYQPTITCVTE